MSASNGTAPKHHAARSDAFWVGRFAMAVALALGRIKDHPESARQHLKAVLGEFLRSPLATPRLRDQLKKEMQP